MNKMLVGLIVGALLGGNGLAQIPEEAQQAEAYYHFSRAMALEGSGQWEAALEEFEKALAIDPTNSMIYSEMAAAYFRRRQVEEATEYGERAIRADADNLDAHQLLSTIYSNMLGQATARGVPPRDHRQGDRGVRAHRPPGSERARSLPDAGAAIPFQERPRESDGGLPGFPENRAGIGGGEPFRWPSCRSTPATSKRPSRS